MRSSSRRSSGVGWAVVWVVVVWVVVILPSSVHSVVQCVDSFPLLGVCSGARAPLRENQRMSFGTLAVIILVGLLGPLLATPPKWRVPVVVGELAAGVLLGPTLAGLLKPDNATFSFLADIGFA